MIIQIMGLPGSGKTELAKSRKKVGSSEQKVTSIEY